MKTRQFILPLLLIAGLALLLAGCSGNRYTLKGNSMLPTYKDGTSLTANADAYKTQLPQRGDIVVYKAADIVRISRVIGLPGERVQIKDGLVYVNGAKLDEPYIMAGARTGPAAEYTVPDGNVFLLSDNREAAQDSRALGPIPVSELKGKINP